MYNNCCISAIRRPILPKFQRNDRTVSSNKSAISADLENVDKGHNLQKPLYVGHYKVDFIKTFTKMMQLGLATKV